MLKRMVNGTSYTVDNGRFSSVSHPSLDPVRGCTLRARDSRYRPLTKDEAIQAQPYRRTLLKHLLD